MPASSPHELHVLFERAFNAGDLAAIAALYEPNAVYVSGGRSIVGRDLIRENYVSILTGAGRLRLTTHAVIRSGPDLALLYGEWTVEAPLNTRGLSTEVVRRQPDGTWLFAIDVPNTPGR